MKLKLFIVIVIMASTLSAQTNGAFSFAGNGTATRFAHFKSDSVGQETLPLKSPGKAFFFSLLLPGSGEYYAGAKKAATYFAAAEVLLWVGVLVNDSYQRELVRDYKSYAISHAGVQRAGKEYQYWIDIGKYDDIYSFNEQRRRDRNFEALYVENPGNFWLWDSKDNRLVYDKNRLHANAVAIRAVYYQAALMLNHFVSAIHAMYQARQFNKRQSHTALNIYFDTPSFGFNAPALRANLSFSF